MANWAFPSFPKSILNTLLLASEGSIESASSHILGASGGESPPLAGLLLVRLSST
ncbi:MAG: hypothetical protein DBX04_01035 [Candidatus Poseidoniales archaeon]|nr:MAG: hypothetical protein DBX04_01035 [Candidatus Poseidoniales archaeon]